jgi:hypothetical protein
MPKVAGERDGFARPVRRVVVPAPVQREVAEVGDRRREDAPLARGSSQLDRLLVELRRPLEVGVGDGDHAEAQCCARHARRVAELPREREALLEEALRLLEITLLQRKHAHPAQRLHPRRGLVASVVMQSVL